MEDYFNAENTKKMLHRCEELGINAVQMRGDKHIMRLLREFRLEGGNLHWIGMGARELASFENNINQMSGMKPSLLFLQGVSTDELYHAGEFDEIIRRLEVMRKTGIPTGLATHMPEVIEYAESHNFNADFYMCCVYNISVPERQKLWYSTGNEDHCFVESDIPLMYQAIRSVDKPCLAFKILGSSRRCESQESVAAAFKECFDSIKENDVAVVGMYPKDIDQVALNVEHALNAIN